MDSVVLVGFWCVLAGLAAGAFVVIELTDRESRELTRLVKTAVARWREAKVRADRAEKELAHARERLSRGDTRPIRVRITGREDN